MATAIDTMTLADRQRKPKDPNQPPENERFLRACSDIASALVQDHESQQDPTAPKRDINLNSLRAKMSKRHKLSNMPPLTAIIAAIPEHYKKYILPKLIAKPISMCPVSRWCLLGLIFSQEVPLVLLLSQLCANLIDVLISPTQETFAFIAPVDLIPISSIPHNRIPVTNLPL